jgi:hypothetical protein
MTHGNMDCKVALPLIASYHDEELSEAQAAPLRQHLMDCPACRKALAGEKAFKRWFPAVTEEVEIPPGFAQRVARRAFAGDLGSESPDVLQPFEAETARDGGQTRILSFVLWATVSAAGLLLAVSGMLFQSHLGEGDNLHADGQGLSKSELLERATLLSDPAGATEFGAAPLEDMSDKSTKRGDSNPDSTGNQAKPLQNGGQ